MADCKNCHYGAEGGGGNFGVVSIVCCYYGSVECDPAGDCENFEAVEHCVERTDCTHSESCPEKPSHCRECSAYLSSRSRKPLYRSRKE